MRAALYNFLFQQQIGFYMYRVSRILGLVTISFKKHNDVRNFCD